MEAMDIAWSSAGGDVGRDCIDTSSSRSPQPHLPCAAPEPSPPLTLRQAERMHSSATSMSLHCRPPTACPSPAPAPAPASLATSHAADAAACRRATT